MTLMDYKFNSTDHILFNTSDEEIKINFDYFKNSLVKTDELLGSIGSYEIDIYDILGMRNLSAFVGEVFARAMSLTSKNFFINNPHQDGYPDLLAMTPEGRAEMDRLKNNMQDKRPFSPFKYGGLEVKATCGSLPTPAVFARKGLVKPTIGDQRIDYLKGYDWKAHHRNTNNLIGLLWDFIEQRPTIVAIFYSHHLTDQDWGTIIQPKEGGGRTTSVSIMNRGGVKKMYEGWVAVYQDKKYVDFLNKYNGGGLIT